MASNLVGRILLDQFRVDSFLDAGGMGSVYRVWDLKRNVPLAMKVMHADLAEDPTMFKRFKREARALSKLAHPNIIPFYGLFDDDHIIFMLERFIDGPTLKDILKKRRGEPLTEFEALIYLKSICSALGYAHEHEVVHCDVKAANIMMDRGGSIFLGDFGIARHSDSSTTTMAGAGTPAYMAPEQILGKTVYPSTDIYAMGILLYEMVTGQRPYRGNESGTENAGDTVNERIRYAQLNLEPPDPRILNPGLNPKLVRVLMKALEKEPGMRYQSCQEMLLDACGALNVLPDQIPDRVNMATNSSPTSVPIQQNQTDHQPTPKKQTVQKNPIIFVVIGVIVVAFFIIIFAGKPKDSTVVSYNNPIIEIQLTATSTQLIRPTLTKKIPSITPTFKPTNTRAPTNTPTKITSCPGAEPQRVNVGDTVKICTKSDRVIVRSEPKPGNNEYFRMYTGTVIEIIDGPQCSDNSSWWLVRVLPGIKVNKNVDFILDKITEGWIREGSDAKDLYYICKVN